LVDSQNRQIMDDNEVRRKFQQFGDVKDVKPVIVNGIKRPEYVLDPIHGNTCSPTLFSQRLVEMYDSRACEIAHDRLRDQSLQDGVMGIEFEWDSPQMQAVPGAHGA